MKNILNLGALIALLASCTNNDIKPAEPSERNFQPGSVFIFGRTSGPDSFAPKPYNVYKISGGKLYGAFVARVNPDSLSVYPMTALSQDKYQMVSSLPALLP